MKRVEPGDVLERQKCFSCRYVTRCKVYDLNDALVPLCWICAYSPAGIAYLQHPTQYPNKDVLQMVAFVGNLMLDTVPTVHANELTEAAERRFTAHNSDPEIDWEGSE